MVDTEQEKKNMMLNEEYNRRVKMSDEEFGEEDQNTPETDSRYYKIYQSVYHPDVQRKRKLVKYNIKRKSVKKSIKKCKCKKK